MGRRSIKIAAAIAAALLAGGQAPPAPTPNLQSQLAPFAYPIALEQGRLNGPGADVLLTAAAKAQFVAIGEEHNNLHIPAITTALFRALHARSGFDYFATEQDPVMMRTISGAPVRGDAARIRALAQRYKHGFTFISDQELQMLADIGAASKGQGRPIWGCEQAFGVTHILDQLSGRARTAAQKRLIASLRSETESKEAVRDLAKGGHYMEQEANGPKLIELSQAFASADPDTRFIADAPRQSNLIYSYYHRSTRGELPGAFSNSAVREEYMKKVCLAEYRFAEKRDGHPPRVVLKMGHWHLYDGWNPNNVTSTGNFFANLARVNGTGYTSVATFSTVFEGQSIWAMDRVGYLRAFKDVVPDKGWVLIDLRALREGPTFRQMRAIAEASGPTGRAEFNRLLYGFDFALFLGPNAGATFEVAKVPY
jgi:hypothetical protein